jgi:hypothetical protein
MALDGSSSADGSGAALKKQPLVAGSVGVTTGSEGEALRSRVKVSTVSNGMQVSWLYKIASAGKYVFLMIILSSVYVLQVDYANVFA